MFGASSSLADCSTEGLRKHEQIEEVRAGHSLLNDGDAGGRAGSRQMSSPTDKARPSQSVHVGGANVNWLHCPQWHRE